VAQEGMEVQEEAATSHAYYTEAVFVSVRGKANKYCLQ